MSIISNPCYRYHFVSGAMNVSLTPKLEELVRQKVASGLYNSSSEVVREALRLLEERDRFKEMQLEEIRHAIQQGVTSLEEGKGVPFDAEDIIQRGRARLKAKQAGA